MAHGALLIPLRSCASHRPTADSQPRSAHTEPSPRAPPACTPLRQHRTAPNPALYTHPHPHTPTQLPTPTSSDIHASTQPRGNQGPVIRGPQVWLAPPGVQHRTIRSSITGTGLRAGRIKGVPVSRRAVESKGDVGEVVGGDQGRRVTGGVGSGPLGKDPSWGSRSCPPQSYLSDSHRPPARRR
jgi:hypothetical protein